MKGWGIGLIVAGVLLALLALTMDTTVETATVPAIAGLGGMVGGSVQNLGRLQQQELTFVGGCALFVAGAMLAGAGAIVEAIGASAGVGRVGVGDHASGVEENPEERDARLAEADRSFNRLFVGIGLALALAALAAWFAVARGPAPEAAAIDENVAAMANALDAEADRLDAMTNGAGAAR